MNNIPEVKLGIVATSRDCFPITLSEKRRKALIVALAAKGVDAYECPVIVEGGIDANVREAVADIEKSGVNALVVFLGNFGPEIPECEVARAFKGPVMFVAAAEENTAVLTSDRGDAYCGMLNASYTAKAMGINPYIPEYPVGTADECADMILDFIPVARALIGLKGLKIITFGPRPHDFLACNAPVAPLFQLGISVEENSELDLLVAYRQHTNDARIPAKIAEMEAELGEGNKMPGILPRLAQYELTLLDWAEQHKGAYDYVVMANKCWPSFQTEFGFVPCYVNSRLTAQGICVACEVDIYGALSEYIGTCVTGAPVTLLDINNSVPADMYSAHIAGKYPYRHNETFMGFHCGNTPMCRLTKGTMRYQLIMKRSLEPDTEPDITRGTLEGAIQPGKITFYRLQGNKDSKLQGYVANGEILPVDPCSFGGIGVFAIPEMNRFYRHVLIEKGYPHHGAVAFAHAGKAIFSVFKMLGVECVGFNQPAGMLYPSENPFA